MPWIKLQTIRDVAALVTGPRVIAAPEYQGRRGHPVAFGRSYREELLALSGDQGARRLLDNRSQELLLLPCADPGIHRDIDCKGDLAKVAV
jgi:molybdenum cofactor cytidylyltransferase